MITKELINIAILGLDKSHQTYLSLGEKCRESIKTNQFKEESLRLDIETESSIIQVLRKSKLPIRIISEEQGCLDLTEDPKCLGVLDGLDGSNPYKANIKDSRYGTMFAIFAGLNPNYGDFIFSGIIEYPTGRLFYASKNNGSYLRENGITQRIRCSNLKSLEKPRIYIDEGTEFNKELFSSKLTKFKPKYLGSSAALCRFNCWKSRFSFRVYKKEKLGNCHC
jgi:fructose-1,6-bisphosphatase/inositol monophosphatase family enzyme